MKKWINIKDITDSSFVNTLGKINALRRQGELSEQTYRSLRGQVIKNPEQVESFIRNIEVHLGGVAESGLRR